jgi:mycoredoxin
METQKQLLFYGAQWCADCRRSKKLLDEYHVSYRYIDIDAVEGAADEVVRINNGLQSIPTICFPDGTVLVEPSNAALLAALRRLEYIPTL